MPGSLAYVFWHWPRPEISREAYEAKLASFLRSMNSEKPVGLLEAQSYRVDALPWGPESGGLYEDWYVVKDFAALGPLNEAAVGGATRTPHDSIAKDYMKGAGGIFKWISGNLPMEEVRFSTWIEKPVGSSYESYYEEVAKITGDRSADLWRRQMVLGPSKQFCLHSKDLIQFPDSLRPTSSRLEQIKTN